MIPHSTQQQLHRIWQRCAEFPAANADSAMQYFMTEMLDILDADSAVWHCAARNKNFIAIPAVDLFDEWYSADVIRVTPKPPALNPLEVFKLYVKLKEKHGPDTVASGVIQAAGSSRGALRSDYLNDEEWADSWLLKEFYEPLNRIDLMYSVFTVDEDCESYILYHRDEGKSFFSESERNIGLTASMGIAHLHRQLMTLRGAKLPCSRLLSPKEKKVLNLLLSGKREKEIALELDISVSTSGKHLSSIYRKLEVSGQFELLQSLA